MWMISSTATGETTFMCPSCLPQWVVFVYERAGIPGMTFDFPDEVAAEHSDELAVPDEAPEPTEADLLAAGIAPGVAAALASDRFRVDPESGAVEILTDEEWEASARTPQTADD